MSLEVGQKILQLRKKHNITQEQLANNIGVSSQAVSKWETDASYPDIGLLPIIAEFFGVSIDCLLGYNVTENTKDMGEYLFEIKQLSVDRKYIEALELIEEVQTYPINYELELLRGRAKLDLYKDEEDEKKKLILLCEAKNIFEMIIQNCNDVKYVNQAKRALAVVFNHFKEYDKAIDILSSIDAHFDTTGVISNSYKLKGDYVSAIKLLQEHLHRSLDNIYKVCFLLCSVHIKMKEFDKALKYIELSDAISEVANKQGKTNFWKGCLLENFFWKEWCLRKAGRTEEALRVLNEQVEFVIDFDNETRDQKNDVWYLNQLIPLGFKWNVSKSERLFNRLNCKGYDKIRSYPEFNNLMVKLEKEVLGKAQEK